MKILLVGEYSRLHNSLKEGFIALGHEVTLISDGDGFKNFPNDISIRSQCDNNLIFKYLNKILFRLFRINLLELERGIRFKSKIKLLKNYDVVQLINESPIKTLPWLERYLLKKIS